ncbi:ArsR/SmtB family transcription factor [Streptomyces sp. QTS52]
MWDLSPPEVSRHLAVLCRTDLLAARRHGRHVRCTVSPPDLTVLGTDLLVAVLR